MVLFRREAQYCIIMYEAVAKVAIRTIANKTNNSVVRNVSEKAKKQITSVVEIDGSPNVRETTPAALQKIRTYDKDAALVATHDASFK